MNERIKELQIQAEAAADEIFDRKGKMYGEIVMEKFAELIVRECMGLVDGYTYPVQSQSHTTYHIASETIKEHFGVEL